MVVLLSTDNEWYYAVIEKVILSKIYKTCFKLFFIILPL